MKTLKTLIIAALMCSYFTNCQNATPTPDTTNTNVVVTPPAPTNKCDNVKNPLEEIEWLKGRVTYFKTYKVASKITKYTYKAKPVYHIEDFVDGCPGFGNCDLSVKASAGTCGFAGVSAEETGLYYNIIQNISNPVVLFEQK
jgi:hypothetical protein